MNSIRFLHIRATADDKILPHGGKTIAYVFTDNPEGKRELCFAVAKCGKKQAFNRKLGRDVAEGMLTCERPSSIEKHVRTIVLDADTHPYDVLLTQV